MHRYLVDPGTVLATEGIKGFVGLAVNVFRAMPGMKINERIEQLLFNATEKYVRTYTERHGYVQVLGMSKPISLDDIYSGARMLDTEAMKSYASQADLEETYRNRGERRFRDYNCPKRNGIEIAKENNRLIVLGDPGIGKSTFLRKVGLEALKGNSGDFQLPHIPVFLELKRFRSPELDLKASIVSEFESCGFPSAKGFTENALKKGQLLLLFDGLDEVPADNLNTVIESIQDLVDEYSDNRFIASCRIAAYHTYFKRVSTVAIAEFDDGQIERFIHNWFSTELDQENQIAEECWKRLQQSENQGAKELAQSPLLLTFLCLVYNKSLAVPSSRTTLYSRALDILLEEWATEKRVGRGEIYEGFHSDLEKELLAKIAYKGLENDQLFFSKGQVIKSIAEFLGDALDAPKNLDASAVLEAIEVQQGILVERATDVYSFSHLTLQEFLAANYIDTWNLQEDLTELHVLDNRWREVFLLVSGLMKGGAIGLLKKLEIQAQELSKHPKLMELLTWTEAKTAHSASDYSGEMKRIFALLLLNDLAIAHYLNRYLPIDNSHVITLILDLTSILNQCYAIAYIIGPVIERIIHIENVQVIMYSIRDFLERKFNLNLDLNSTRIGTFGIAHDLVEFCFQEGLLYDVYLQRLTSYLENPSIQSLESSEDLLAQISSSLDISADLFDLSEDDVKAFSNYFSTCKLMIDCSKQTSGLSAKDWNAIKQRMFLPPQS